MIVLAVQLAEGLCFDEIARASQGSIDPAAECGEEEQYNDKAARKPSKRSPGKTGVMFAQQCCQCREGKTDERPQKHHHHIAKNKFFHSPHLA